MRPRKLTQCVTRFFFSTLRRYLWTSIRVSIPTRILYCRLFIISTTKATPVAIRVKAWFYGARYITYVLNQRIVSPICSQWNLTDNNLGDRGIWIRTDEKPIDRSFFFFFLSLLIRWHEMKLNYSTYFCLFSITGGNGGQTSYFYASQQSRKLQQHDTSRYGPGQQTGPTTRCWSTDGHLDRCLSTMHPKHIWCHTVHSVDMGRWNGRSHTRLPHRPLLLLCRKSFLDCFFTF